jgi:hypothetical protein
MTSELTSDIEQWTNQRNVFEEREDTSTYALCRQQEVSVEEKQKQLDQRGPTCGVAISAIETPNDLKKLLEERAPHQQEPPQENQLLVQQPLSPQQQQQRQRKSLEEDCPISSVLKRYPILVECTQLNSIQEEGTKKEVSEENAGPIEEIEGKQVEEEKHFNKENKTKNDMSNNRATEAVNPKKRTTAALERNGEDDFDFVLKPINQHQLVVTTSTNSQARSCRIEGLYTKFGEDHITLQQAGRWSENIIGRQGIG